MTEERRQKFEKVLARRQNDLTVVLENVIDPHNISAVMRSCDAVGIQEIYVLNTKIPRHKKWGFHSSRSAAKWITVHQFEDVVVCFNAIRKNYSSIFTTCLTTNSISLYSMDLTSSMALVFGNEQYGVSDEINAMADGSFVIPQVGMIQSLNISVACAVTLYEAFRQKHIAGHYKNQNIPQEQYDQLFNQWTLNRKSDS
jgi:tRNA (guanosine-2'-O-)-methyltransferase